jgi:hypothetical protein
VQVSRSAGSAPVRPNRSDPLDSRGNESSKPDARVTASGAWHGAGVANSFEGDDPIALTKREAFQVLAALMDAIELIDRANPAFQVSWERLRASIELLSDHQQPGKPAAAPTTSTASSAAPTTTANVTAHQPVARGAANRARRRRASLPTASRSPRGRACGTRCSGALRARRRSFPAFQIAPPLEFIPPERHGDTFCAAVVHWAGPLEEGEAAMKPFRDLAPVVAEMVGPMPYPALNAAFDALFPKGIRSYWKGSFVTDLSDAAIDAHQIHGPQVPEVSATMHLYPINGACHRVEADETAFAHRDATFATVIVAAWQDPSVDAERIAWVRDYYRATAPHSEPGGYVNFMADDDQCRVPDNYRTNYRRLVEVKRTYDLFHRNHNIDPNA